MIVSLKRENSALYFDPISESLFALMTKKVFSSQCSSEVKKDGYYHLIPPPLKTPNVMLSKI